MERLHLLVRGRVQGVGFRGFVWSRARELGVAGEVRNRSDGGVEVTAEGERSRLEELLQAIRSGPPAARVSGVEEVWSSGTPRFDGFRIGG